MLVCHNFLIFTPLQATFAIWTSKPCVFNSFKRSLMFIGFSVYDQCKMYTYLLVSVLLRVVYFPDAPCLCAIAQISSRW